MRHQCTRPPLRRLRAIISHLKKGHYPNCTRLARELEVERRTVLRDIEYLRDSLEVPVEYDPHHYGYHLDGQFPELPTPNINQAELLALILAERALHEFIGTPFEKSLRSAIEKLTETLQDTIPIQTEIDPKNDDAKRLTPSPLGGERAGVRGARLPSHMHESCVSFHDFPCQSPNLQLFQTISEALNQRREIQFSYRKPQAKRTERRHVRPYHLACIHRQWYLFAFDRLRQDIRRFVLSRMKHVTLTETTFTIPADFSAEKLLTGSFGVHSATGDYHIIIRFTGLAATLVREKKWHPSQRIISLPDGEIELHLHLTSLEEVESWILSWGSDAEVLNPEKLRKQIAQKAKRITDFYTKGKQTTSICH